MDLELSQREGFHFGLKLVRGAYLDQERERAAQLNYTDPTQPSYEATSQCVYCFSLFYVIFRCSATCFTSFMFCNM